MPFITATVPDQPRGIDCAAGGDATEHSIFRNDGVREPVRHIPCQLVIKNKIMAITMPVCSIGWELGKRLTMAQTEAGVYIKKDANGDYIGINNKLVILAERTQMLASVVPEKETTWRICAVKAGA
jgi:hypothetical protein